MNKTLKKKDGKSGEIKSKQMTGSQILVEAFHREGVDTIFAYPGGASMEIHQALTRSHRIRTILPRHEQGGSFAASGYARATGKAGVCMTTSGPGATNLITAIADAYMDSVPLIAITGQVPKWLIGKNAFQETDVFGVTLPIVKHSYLVTDVNDLTRIVKEAFYIAQTARPGPVVIDFPKNIQQAVTTPNWDVEMDIPGYDPDVKADESVFEQIVELLEKSERPVIYCGGGIISSNASKELRRFVELAGIPVTTTLMGIGAFPEDHPLSLRWLGMHGAAFANWAVNGEYAIRKNTNEPMIKINDGADLLLALGVRFDDRVTGKVDKFCENGVILHIDIDSSEHNKNRRVQYPILCDVKYALEQLNRILSKKPLKKKYDKWHRQIAEWKEKGKFAYKVTEEVLKSQHIRDHLQDKEEEVILPQMAIEKLYEITKGEAIIATGVGQHQMWSAQYYKFKYPRQFITSGGLGSMGFGYPAALGAKVGRPDKEVIDIDGDGSFLMNIQELATAYIEKISAKAMIMNNQHLGMVAQWEDRFYNGHRGHTYLGDPEDRRDIYPNYVAVCTAFGIKCERVMYKRDLPKAIERMLESREPYVLDVVVPYTEHVLPFIPAGATVADMIVE